jgi:tricorn protease-like protein
MFAVLQASSLKPSARAQSYSNFWSVELPERGDQSQASAKPLTSGTLWYADPAISPDGHWLALTLISGNRGNVYKMPVEGGQPLQLTFFASTELGTLYGRRTASAVHLLAIKTARRKYG